jgi:hypothetical protein
MGYQSRANDGTIVFRHSWWNLATVSPKRIIASITRYQDEKIMFGLHVDDKFYVPTSEALVNEFVDCLQARFGNITHNSGDVLSFLGVEGEEKVMN